MQLSFIRLEGRLSDMESQVKKTILIRLVLNEEEAEWLRGLVQNPHCSDPNGEPEDERKIRMNFWKALETREFK